MFTCVVLYDYYMIIIRCTLDTYIYSYKSMSICYCQQKMEDQKSHTYDYIKDSYQTSGFYLHCSFNV